MRILLALAFLCSPVYGGSLTYHEVFSNHDHVPAIPQFRAGPGITLYEVDVAITGQTTWSIQVAPGLSSGTYEATSMMGLTVAGCWPLGSSSRDVTFSFPSPASSMILSNNFAFEARFTSGLSPWIGSGSYYPIGIQDHRFLSTDVPVQSQSDTSVFSLLDYEVTYQFAVPEPSACVLLGTAIAVLVALRIIKRGP